MAVMAGCGYARVPRRPIPFPIPAEDVRDEQPALPIAARSVESGLTVVDSGLFAEITADIAVEPNRRMRAIESRDREYRGPSEPDSITSVREPCPRDGRAYPPLRAG